MKRLLSALTALALCLSLCPAAFAAGGEAESAPPEGTVALWKQGDGEAQYVNMEQLTKLLITVLSTVENDRVQVTITLLSDITVTGNELDIGGQYTDYTLDLGGHTIQSDTTHRLVSSGQATTLTVTGTGRIGYLEKVFDSSLAVRGDVTFGTLKISGHWDGDQISLSAGHYDTITIQRELSINCRDLLAQGFAFYQNGEPSMGASKALSSADVKVCGHENSGTDRHDGTHGGTCQVCRGIVPSGAHTPDKDGICTGCGTELKAEVGGKYYTLLDAWAAAKEASPATVTLIATEGGLASTLTVEDGSDITLDGGEYSINTSWSSQYDVVRVTGGRLTVTGGSISTNANGQAALVVEGGEVRLSGGSFRGYSAAIAANQPLSRLLAGSGGTHCAFYQGSTPLKLEAEQTSLPGRKIYFVKVCTGTAEAAGNGGGAHTMSCAVCGYAAEEECTPGSGYQSDGDSHWKVCTVCGDELGKEAHTISTSDEPPASGNVTTNKTACTVCARELASYRVTVSVPAELTYGQTGGQALGYTVDPAVEFQSWHWLLDGSTVLTENALPADADLTVGEHSLVFEGEFAQGSFLHGYATFQVVPRAVAVTGLEATDREYDGTNEVAVTKVTTEDGTELTVTAVGVLSSENAGTYQEVTLKEDIPVDANSVIKAGTVVANVNSGAGVTIAKSQPSLTWKDAPTKTYDGQPPALTEENLTVTGAAFQDVKFQYAWVKGDEDVEELTAPPVNAGKYTIRPYIPETANTAPYTGSEIIFYINPRTVTTPTVTVSPSSVPYTGQPRTPAVTVKDGVLVIDPSEYTVEYADHVEIGTATVTIKDKEGGNCEIAEVSATFEITKPSSSGGGGGGGTVNPPVNPNPPTDPDNPDHPNPPTDQTETKVEVTPGLSEVPPAFADIPTLNTPAKIIAALRTAITQLSAGIPWSNIAVYDVTLMVSTDGGKTWTEATRDNFPASGKLTVTLPYPAGTNRSDHFTVVHMFTTADFGKTPGEVERPAVTNMEEGIRFTVTGLSPISVGWTKAAEPNRPSGGGSSSSGGSGGGSSSTYPVSVKKPSHGKVDSSWKNASSGSTVTLTVTPDSGYVLDTLTVTDSRGNTIKLTDKGGGKFAFTMPGRTVTVTAAFVPLQTEWRSPYSDVRPGAWYYDAVQFVTENGLMDGYTSTQFAPDGALSRAQLAQILYNRAGRPTVAGGSFTDTAPGAWYADAVAWAAAKGIVSGYGDGRFGPDDNLTREQLAVILWRYAGSPTPPNLLLSFPDAGTASGYALDALRWAVDQKILNGSSGHLAPKTSTSRGQAAQMLRKFFEMQ